MRIALCMLWLACHPLWAQKNLVFEDRVYEPQIRTAQCFPMQASDGNPNTMLPSGARLESQNLILEFDDLQDQKNNYYVRLIHCNFDWTKSGLMDLDFMRDYNEFNINDYTFSVNTHIPYVHYRFPVPPVKIPGNYLVIVYRDGDRKDLILSKRIFIYDGRIGLTEPNDISGLGNLRSTNQALNFIVDYSRTEVINPLNNLHVVIRQNQRWDNAKLDVKPSFDREDVSQLEYRFFNMDKTFQGGNEFRFVDFQSLNYPGQNTYKLDKSHKPYDLSVMLDADRGSQAYSQYPDLNGNYIVNNKDSDEPWISANYVNVTFGLKTPPLNGDVYVIGAFNGWVRSAENKLVYDQGIYAKKILLKQGLYNYAYWVDSSSGDVNQIEGNHFETENLYEVLIYYRGFQLNADLLIGYYAIPVNPR
jgi:Domain of unknown function (DUF5103)